MGTRHLVAVQFGGEYKVAQYGQWDGYPDGQGARVLDFLRNGDVEALKRNLALTYDATEDEQAAMWASIGVDIIASNGSVEWGKSKIFAEKYPSLHRDTGAGILELIAGSDGEEKIPLTLNIEFAGESLFCEWAYVIDFDIGTFEVYKGFNKEPVPADSRFASIPFDSDGASRIGTTYYQVTLAESWKLSALPSEEEFVAAFKSPDEDEEAEEVLDDAPQEPTAGSAPEVNEDSTAPGPVWAE